MKKMLLLLAIIAVGSASALQVVEFYVSNALPATATAAALYGYKTFTAEGESMKVFSELVDVTLSTPTSMTNAAQIAVSNFSGYVVANYGKFATTTAQTYENCFRYGQEVRLLAKTTHAASLGATGTNIRQKVYCVIY